MLAEVVGYRSNADHALLTIAVDQVQVIARLIAIPEGFRLRVGNLESAPYRTESAAVAAACRYAERMVLGAER